MASKTLGSVAVGSTVKLKENGAAVDYLVVHQGRPSTLYDTSCNGTWLLRKDIEDTWRWHSSNVNDWANSTLKAYLDSTFLNRFDANTKNAIKQVKIPYRPGSGTSTSVNSGADGLSCKVFLLSCREVGYTQSNGGQHMVYDGVKLSYFNDGATNEKIAYLNGSATDWWLRSPYTYDSLLVLFVLPNGGYNHSYCSQYFGVRPALILPTDVCVDASGNVVASRAPTISDSDRGLGTFGETPPTASYTINDPDGDTVTVSETLDGKAFRTYTATLGNTYSMAFTAAQWAQVLNGSHTFKVTATDPYGAYTERTYTFTKKVTQVNFTTDAMPADAMPTVAVASVIGSFPLGSVLTVEACNNGSDAEPVWQDVTDKVLNSKKIFFSNQDKAADTWGVAFRVTLDRGTATGECYITSIGGAFE